MTPEHSLRCYHKLGEIRTLLISTEFWAAPSHSERYSGLGLVPSGILLFEHRDDQDSEVLVRHSFADESDG